MKKYIPVFAVALLAGLAIGVPVALRRADSVAPVAAPQPTVPVVASPLYGYLVNASTRSALVGGM